MANKKISELAASSPLSVGDLFEVMQGGVNKKVDGSQLLTFVGSSAFVDGETPSGLVNDSNTVFTIASTPVTGSVKVFKNGMRQKVTSDYTISGTTITFVVAPETGDTLLVDYRI